MPIVLASTESDAVVQLALARLRAGRTTIVIAHGRSTVPAADVVVAMADGRAAETGTHASLLAEDGWYARLVRSQVVAPMAVRSRRPPPYATPA